MTQDNPPQTNNREVSRFLYLLGILLFCFAAVQGWNSFRFLQNSKIATGVVVRIDKRITHGDQGQRIRLIPIVRFIDYRGTDREAEALELLEPHNIGESVPIRYSTIYSNVAEEDSFQALWQWPLGLSLAGTFLCVIAWKWNWHRKKA